MAELQTLAGKASFPLIGQFAERDFEAMYSRFAVKSRDAAEASPVNSYDGLEKIRVGVELTGLGRFAEALAALNHAVVVLPKNFHAHFFLGDALNKLNRHEEALAAFNRAVRLDHGRPTGHFLQGVTLANLQRFDEALKAYENALHILEKSADYAQVNNVISGGTSGNKLYNAEIENKSIRQTKTGATGEKIMGKNAARKIVTAPAALETTRRAESLINGRGLAEIHRARGWTLVELGRYDDALNAFATAINLSPENAEGQYARGWLLVQLDRFAEALPAIDKAVTFDPGNGRSRFLQGLALAALDRHSDALPAYSRAIALGLDEAAVHFNRGMALGRLEQFDEAHKAFDHAVRLDPNEPVYEKGRRWALESAAKLAQAETTQRAEPRLSDAELAEFHACAKANPWDSKSGVAPSVHIRETFKEWLGRGLGRSDIVKAQPNLASAYAAEVSRNPAKRVEGLSVRPHRLPPDAPRPLWTYRAAELTDEDLALKRAHGREQKRRSRQKLRTLTHS